MTHRSKAFPPTMSGGEQQRIAIARAIAKNPKVLFCDEPTGALDYKTGKQVLEIIETLNREMGMTVVLVTHNIDEALILGDQVLAMAGGRVARQFDLQDQSWPRDVLAPQLIEIKRQILSEMEGENP